VSVYIKLVNLGFGFGSARTAVESRLWSSQSCRFSSSSALHSRAAAAAGAAAAVAPPPPGAAATTAAAPAAVAAAAVSFASRHVVATTYDERKCRKSCKEEAGGRGDISTVQ
jgi:hypothetical protein